jgi:hypothetical protein
MGGPVSNVDNIPGVRLVLRDREIELAEKMPGPDSQALGVIAGVRYWYGGSGPAQLWNLYDPETYGHMIYSNVMFRTEVVQDPTGLRQTKLIVAGHERTRGKLWYLVALSPIHKDDAGKRLCSAIVQGWWFDERGEDKEVVLSSMELQRPAPVYWLGVTDDGKKTEWANAVRKARDTNLRAGAEDAQRSDAVNARKAAS